MKIENKRLIKKFDKNKYDFQKIFLLYFKKFNLKNLEKIHHSIPKKLIPKNVVNVKNDQQQLIYKYLYNIDKGYSLKRKKKESFFLKTFQRFVSFLAKNIFKQSLVYQAKPTLRIMFPNNKAVGEFHRDRDYNHPLDEINIWVPITSSKKTNTIWIESKFDKNDYKPMNLDYGQFLIFDSGLKHGNRINKENKTRISFDFRVIPYSVWKKNKNRNKNNKYSIDQKIKFEIGGYYKLKRI